MIAPGLHRFAVSLAVVIGTWLGAPGWSAVPAQVEVTVNGMVCSFCAQGIERNLRRLPTTQSVSVDLKAHRVMISLKPGAAVDDQQIRQAIRDSGFDVKQIRYVKLTP